MLKKTIKYTDLDGNPAEMDAYFNLTKAEAIELNIRNDLEVIGRSMNKNEIMDAFHRVLQMSYGVRTGDGRFIKVNPTGAPLYYEFKTTEAYSELFMELFSNEAYALEFIKAILPPDVVLESAQASQAPVPSHLQQHPSMQGFKKPDETPRKLPTEMTPAVQPDSLGENAAEYQEWLREKAAKQAQAQFDADEAAARAGQIPPAQVSPEVPQESSPPRDELI